MDERRRTEEQSVSNTNDRGEMRSVSLLEAEDLAVIERSSGPATEVAYGSAAHGHKMMAGYDAYARVLGVASDEVTAAVERFFAALDGEGEAETPMLSDLMDCFDRAGERYAYVAWDEGANVAMRR